MSSTARLKNTSDIPLWLWIGLPVVTVIALVATPLLGREQWQWVMLGEGGFIEVATVLFLLITLPVPLWLIRHRRRLPRLASVLLPLGALPIIYFAGEEANWGQFLIEFDAPDPITRISREDNEFNLHKISHPVGRFIFNTGPRTVATMTCLVFGVIVPLASRWMGPGVRLPGRNAYWLLPGYRLVPISLLAVLATTGQKLLRSASTPEAEGYIDMLLVKPAGEVKEYAIAAAIMIYYLSIHTRLRSMLRQTQDDVDGVRNPE